MKCSCEIPIELKPAAERYIAPALYKKLAMQVLKLNIDLTEWRKINNEQLIPIMF